MILKSMCLIGAVLTLAVPAQAKCIASDAGKCVDEVVRGRCLLEVGGKKYLDERCNIEWADEDGSFSIGTSENGPASRFFAYVNKNEDGTAEASWNGKHGGSHAHDSLGTVKKDGDACWVSSTAKICGWR